MHSSHSSKHLVLTIHGIRTYGKWQERLAAAIYRNDPDVEVRHYRYNYFSIVGFLVPFVRWHATRRFARDLRHACSSKQWDRVDVVAHSFGTHLLAWALFRMPPHTRPALHTVILAGSVLPASFPWSALCPTTVKRVVNECGVRDGALVASQLVSLFTGMAGREGFIGWKTAYLKNRYYSFGHSGYFVGHDGRDNDFMADNWVPLLTSDATIPEHDVPRNWASGLTDTVLRNCAALKLLAYVSIVALVALYLLGLYAREAAQRATADARRELIQAGADLWLAPQSAVSQLALLHGRLPDAELQPTIDAAAPQRAVRSVLVQPGFAPVSAAAFSTDGQYILTSDRWARICVWPRVVASKPTCVETFGLFNVAAASIRGRLLLAPHRSQDGVSYGLQQVDVVTKQRKTIASVPLGPITSAVWSSNGRYVGYSSYNFRAYILDTHTGRVLELRRHPDIVNSIRFDQAGQRAVTTCQDGRARVFDVASGQLTTVVRVYAPSLVNAEFDPRSTDRIATAGLDGRAHLWSIGDQRAVGIVAAHKDELRQVAFSPTENVLAAASVDGTGSVWAVEVPARRRALLHGHRGAVTAVSFDPSGKELLTGSLDGTVRVWATSDALQMDAGRL
jgi:hypothetical protein